MKNSPCLFSTVPDGKRFSWEITRRCNFGCRHCCVQADKYKNKDLTTNEAINAIKEMVANKVKALYITGGEPSLHQALIKLLKLAKRLKIKVNLATNGSFKESFITQIASANLNSVLISLDGPDARTNNFFRNNEKAFRKATNSIKKLSISGVKVKVGTVIWKGNIKRLEDMIKLAISLKAKRIYFSWPIAIGRLKNNLNVIAPEYKFAKCREELEVMTKKYKKQINVSFKRFSPLNCNSSNCPGAKKLYHMDNKGYIYPCSWMAKIEPYFKSNYSIVEKPLAILLKDVRLKEFIILKKEREKSFGPGCPAICILKNGAINSKDSLYNTLS